MNRFVTQNGVTDYWIGPAGTAPPDVFDTGLNIQQLGPIKPDTFYDRSNYRLLKRMQENPLGYTFNNRDSSAYYGKPRVWRNDPDTPNIINIYPAPNNQNNFQPEPNAPACGYTAGGSLPARIYFARTTYVDSLGNESAASEEAQFFVPANCVAVVQPPIEPVASATGVQYNMWNLYLYDAGNNNTLSTGAETLANQTGPINNQTAYTEPTSGFTPNGPSYPTASNITQLYGYVIEFRYYLPKPQVTAFDQLLLVPFDYFDVMVHGVDSLAVKYIKDDAAVDYWREKFETGLIGMVRDKWLFPKGPDFIGTDPAAQTTTNWYGYDDTDAYYLPYL